MARERYVTKGARARQISHPLLEHPSFNNVRSGAAETVVVAGAKYIMGARPRHRDPLVLIVAHRAGGSGLRRPRIHHQGHFLSKPGAEMARRFEHCKMT